jgi:hypothetical protein
VSTLGRRTTTLAALADAAYAVPVSTPVDDSAALSEALALSRRTTEPHVFDHAAAAAEWRAHTAAIAVTRAPTLDEAERQRVTDLHRALDAVSLPSAPTLVVKRGRRTRRATPGR